jgi:AAA15 family ATPase/GTPase
MRIKSIDITNYRTIEKVKLNNIPELVVLTGPNGVRKSSIMEAISYWKETVATYGPYEYGPSFFTNEIKSNIVSNDQEQSQIVIDIELSDNEIKFLKQTKNLDCEKNFTSFLNIKKGGNALNYSSQNYLDVLLKNFDRKNNLNLGIFNYVRGERSLIDSLNPKFDNQYYKNEKDI